MILTTDNNFGCPSDKDTLEVTFKASPIADFTFDVACFGENTNFEDASTTASGTISSWSWDFDDNGSTSNLEDPTYTFSLPGSSNVELIVGGSNGCF